MPAPRSRFFYLQWKRCYSAYASAVRENFKAGLKHVATFDLTAFYDFIDHNVLKIFLLRSGVDPTP